VCGPPAQASRSERAPRPWISTRKIAPVMASKPVAKMTASSGYSAAEVRIPSGVKSSIGSLRRSTSVTFSRLNVSK
jgi:hypothetical protein